MFAPTVIQIVLLGCAGLLVWAAASDMLRFRIPNRVSLAIAALWPAYLLASWIGGVPVAPLGGLIAGLGVFAAGFLLFNRGLLGGGDVKLMSATALWAGLSGLAPFVIIVAAAGGLLSLGMVAATGLSYMRQPALRPAGLPMWRALLRQPAPYGVAIAAGGLFTLARLAGFSFAL
ncbi:MAG: prepilin peptidase [Alphaproteobacteria bacterium]